MEWTLVAAGQTGGKILDCSSKQPTGLCNGRKGRTTKQPKSGSPKLPRETQATLGIETDQEARKLQELGQQVSTLDGTLSKEGEAQARQIESQYRNVVNKGIFQPRPTATASDQGQAGIL